jgi:hypothetical protein
MGTSCEILAGLALVVRSQLLVFAMQEFALVARKTTPGGVVISADTPRF